MDMTWPLFVDANLWETVGDTNTNCYNHTYDVVIPPMYVFTLFLLGHFRRRRNSLNEYILGVELRWNSERKIRMSNQ